MLQDLWPCSPFTCAPHRSIVAYASQQFGVVRLDDGRKVTLVPPARMEGGMCCGRLAAAKPPRLPVSRLDPNCKNDIVPWGICSGWGVHLTGASDLSPRVDRKRSLQTWRMSALSWWL